MISQKKIDAIIIIAFIIIVFASFMFSIQPKINTMVEKTDNETFLIFHDYNNEIGNTTLQNYATGISFFVVLLFVIVTIIHSINIWFAIKIKNLAIHTKDKITQFIYILASFIFIIITLVFYKAFANDIQVNLPDELTLQNIIATNTKYLAVSHLSVFSSLAVVLGSIIFYILGKRHVSD